MVSTNKMIEKENERNLGINKKVTCEKNPNFSKLIWINEHKKLKNKPTPNN